MIVVDTSALMAILLDEPDGQRCLDSLAQPGKILIAAGTLTECLIVAQRRNLADEMTALLAGLAVDVVPIDARMARLAADAYRRWGKGNHPAGLNFGDCFAYALAQAVGYPLLYVGNDFAQTDMFTHPAASANG